LFFSGLPLLGIRGCFSAAKSEKAIFIFRGNSTQHPSENIYSVLAFINILLKQQQKAKKLFSEKATEREKLFD